MPTTYTILVAAFCALATASPAGSPERQGEDLAARTIETTPRGPIIPASAARTIETTPGGPIIPAATPVALKEREIETTPGGPIIPGPSPLAARTIETTPGGPIIPALAARTIETTPGGPIIPAATPLAMKRDGNGEQPGTWITYTTSASTSA